MFFLKKHWRFTVPAIIALCMILLGVFMLYTTSEPPEPKTVYTMPERTSPNSPPAVNTGGVSPTGGGSIYTQHGPSTDEFAHKKLTEAEAERRVDELLAEKAELTARIDELLSQKADRKKQRERELAQLREIADSVVDLMTRASEKGKEIQFMFEPDFTPERFVELVPDAVERAYYTQIAEECHALVDEVTTILANAPPAFRDEVLKVAHEKYDNPATRAIIADVRRKMRGGSDS